MLVSHRKHFIFTKTTKTAVTSIESYFEPYCMADGEWQKSHLRDEYVSEFGIIGYRGPDPSNSTFYHHLSAMEIRDLIGEDIWNSYFKFTVIRNPFDKLISAFWFFEDYHQSQKKKYGYIKRINTFVKTQILDRGMPIERVKGKTEIERFRSWIRKGGPLFVRKGGPIIDRNKYLIDEQECIDYFIRFENLYEGIKNVCDRLSIPFEPSRIPEFKKGIRSHKIPILDYYDDDTEQIVRKIYAWELKRFGYDLPK